MCICRCTIRLELSAFRELDWKTPIFFESAVPITPNAPRRLRRRGHGRRLRRWHEPERRRRGRCDAGLKHTVPPRNIAVHTVSLSIISFGHDRGSTAPSPRTAAHPLHTGFAKTIGVFFFLLRLRCGRTPASATEIQKDSRSCYMSKETKYRW
jgi:hypothetical protein